jgi:hypothetical protein
MADSSKDMRMCALNESEILQELFADRNSDVMSDEDEETVSHAVDSKSDEEIAVSRKLPRVLAISLSDSESDEDVNIFNVEGIEAEDDFKGTDPQRNQMLHSQKKIR